MSVCGKWTVKYHPVFNQQYQDLIAKVKKQRNKLEQGKLTSEKFKKHPDVKLLANLRTCIKEKIVENPLDERYQLRSPLQDYSRVKGLGLPPKYRLFFLVKTEKCMIVILWLGYPREQGSRKDCYEVFKKKVTKGEFPIDSEDLLPS